jgi:signal transduction histidine kinase
MIPTVPAFFSRRNHLQWLALLAIAVLLPTASLLWFMSRVIANERLAVQEKLRVLYQDKLTEATTRTDSLFSRQIATLDQIKPGMNPYSLFRRLVLENNFQGVVVWDADGLLQYPGTGGPMGNTVSSGNPLADAWQLEFAKREYPDAAAAYGRFTADNDPHIAIAAMAGKARCLSRSGRLDEAIEECQKAAFAAPIETGDPALRLTIENARLLLLSLLKQSGPSPANTAIFRRVVNSLAGDLYSSSGDRALLPANQNLFIAQKVLDALKGPFSFNDTKAKAQLEKLAAAEELSITTAESLRPLAGQFDTVFKIRLGETRVFGLRHQASSTTLLALLSDAGVRSALAGYHDTFTGTEASYRILDPSDNFVAGTAEPHGKPFTVAPLPQSFPGWKAELYFEGGDIFEKAANRQIAVYTWTGFLVIVLILIVGGLATRAMSRQIRLNEMKNDFIATVSHELKTPLASMRVLVDTLLEGNVKDQAQGGQYLQLIAKENERLSRMIDNFLTFSRMERNKVAFTLLDASPGAIASDAIAAVQTKYASNSCHLTVEIAESLPVIQADHDAIVTVLVNLLDNACKYTAENKQVSLKVFRDGDAVCFSVTDNGIGLARRHIRRIFDRFYQVDSSLARKVEGCGLGLSIVKFIVDAHKGKITVESKPDQGSTFMVRLPIGPANGD